MRGGEGVGGVVIKSRRSKTTEVLDYWYCLPCWDRRGPPPGYGPPPSYFPPPGAYAPGYPPPGGHVANVGSRGFEWFEGFGHLSVWVSSVFLSTVEAQRHPPCCMVGSPWFAVFGRMISA